VALIGQLLLYSIGLAAIFSDRLSRSKYVAGIGSFIVLNAAAWMGFWVWITGQTETVWRKTHYEST
jgi:hypothetical protein